MATGKELEVKKNQAIGAAIDFSKDAGAGMEGADKDSFAIPFLALLQGLSPAIETVEGAKPGLIINTVTNKLYKELRFVPVAFSRRYLKWEPRSKGGGFKGEVMPSDAEQMIIDGVLKTVTQMIDGKERTSIQDKDGIIYSDTRQHYVLYEDGDVWVPAMISMARTQIKRSKKMMSQISGILMKGDGGSFSPPSYAHVYTAKAEKESGGGNEWWSWNLALTGPVDREELYSKAKALNKQIVGGKVKVDHSNNPDAEGTTVKGKVSDKPGF